MISWFFKGLIRDVVLIFHFVETSGVEIKLLHYLNSSNQSFRSNKLYSLFVKHEDMNFSSG
jgi:hypothetical protein